MKLFKTLFAPEGSGGGSGGGGIFTPSFDGALQPDGSFAEGWHTKAFGADYNGPLASAKTVADVDKMLRDSMTAARQKTEGMIRIPGEGAKPEDIAAFHKALGVPEKPEEYGYKLPEGLKEENIDKARIDSWRQEFKAAGIPKAQAERLINKQLADEAAALKARTEEFNKGLELEKAELAKRFPEIGKTVAAVKALANRNGTPESLKNAIAKGAFDPTNQAAFWGADALEAIAWVAKASGEDRGAGGGGGASGGMTIAEAQRIMSDKSHPLHEKYMKGDKEVTAKVTAAYAAGV